MERVVEASCQEGLQGGHAMDDDNKKKTFNKPDKIDSVSSGLDPHRRDNFFSGNVWILVIKDFQISKKKTHVMTMDTSYLQSCLCSLHIPTIQCPNSQCNEQANAGIKRIKDQHSYHRCKPQPNIQASSSFDCG
uniref:Uncharacterized protein LOC111117207 isoform X3 n=1 Tax=Crassostrea virginica TaxID=6565 RepID=A0A8B8C8C4_CRAVI|nr:uncharacterized protein LOC111117207 isoform X3 [Crassostrea virginica]